jgi:hypothetical protein
VSNRIQQYVVPVWIVRKAHKPFVSAQSAKLTKKEQIHALVDSNYFIV